jgi:hypothetical protein
MHFDEFIEISYQQDREGIHRGIRVVHPIGDAIPSLPVDVWSDRQVEQPDTPKNKIIQKKFRKI